LYTKCSELPVNTPMRILKATKLESKHGLCLKIEMDKCFACLPKRYAEITDEEVIEMSSGSYFLVRLPGTRPLSFEVKKQGEIPESQPFLMEELNYIFEEENAP